MRMISVPTSELSDSALNWAVARSKGIKVAIDNGYKRLWHDRGANEPWGDEVTFFTWEQVGAIIEGIPGFELKIWLDSKQENRCEAHIHSYEGDWVAFGPTPLVAAMRCYVASRLGDTVDVPTVLVNPDEPRESDDTGCSSAPMRPRMS